MGATGIGALLGGLTLASKRGVEGLGRWVWVAATAWGRRLILFSTSRHFWLSSCFLAPAGFAMLIQMGSCNTLVQVMVPDRLRGRVMGLYTMMFVGMAPVGALLAGLIAAKAGAPWTVALGGLTSLAGAGIFGEDDLRDDAQVHKASNSRAGNGRNQAKLMADNSRRPKIIPPTDKTLLVRQIVPNQCFKSLQAVREVRNEQAEPICRLFFGWDAPFDRLVTRVEHAVNRLGGDVGATHRRMQNAVAARIPVIFGPVPYFVAQEHATPIKPWIQLKQLRPKLPVIAARRNADQIAFLRERPHVKQQQRHLAAFQRYFFLVNVEIFKNEVRKIEARLVFVVGSAESALPVELVGI